MTHDQHVVPQVYLKNFAEGKMCYVIDGYGKIQNKSIDGICYEKDYYEFIMPNGNKVVSNITENTLQKIETIYSDFIEDLLRAINQDRGLYFLKQEDNKLCLITWIILMLLRNPLVFSLTSEVAEALGHKLNDIQSHNNAILNISLFLEDISRRINKTHKIVFIKNTSEISFITSNYPSIFAKDSNGEERGYMPLSSRYYVLLVNKKNKSLKEGEIIPAKPSVVEYYNKRIISNVIHVKTNVNYKYIISKDRKSLEYYHEYIKKEISEKS